jgi:hypothetical protein
MARLRSHARNRQVTHVIDRDGDDCVWCSKKLVLGMQTLDHALPYARGGSNRTVNLVLACPSCNVGRGVRPLREWGKLCEKRGKKVQWLLVEAAIERVQLMPEVWRDFDPGAPVRRLPLNVIEDLCWETYETLAA